MLVPEIEDPGCWSQVEYFLRCTILTEYNGFWTVVPGMLCLSYCLFAVMSKLWLVLVCYVQTRLSSL